MPFDCVAFTIVTLDIDSRILSTKQDRIGGGKKNNFPSSLLIYFLSSLFLRIREGGFSPIYWILLFCVFILILEACDVTAAADVGAFSSHSSIKQAKRRYREREKERKRKPIDSICRDGIAGAACLFTSHSG